MSHGHDASGKDAYYLEPKEVLSQYSVEWVTLRQSYSEINVQLQEVQAGLSELDQKLARGEISDQEHISQYQERWMQSTQIVQVKREVEARLYEIQREIRRANRQLKELEAERLRKDHLEQEKSNAMIEWMSLKQGFDVVSERRREINREMDRLELQRRAGQISDEEYRRQQLEQIGQLAELRTVETDVKRRLAELLEIIKK
ncbi:MAG: hypothetical protein RTU30_06355 [Candidatus Thorarchaeota archaeon]